MFAKIFLLVKNNAGTAVIDNPLIPEKYHDAVINEASSSIIESLKSHVESGRLKEVLKYFQHPEIYQSPLVAAVTKKFANRINTYYGIEPAAAMQVAKQLIPVVMQQLACELKTSTDTEFNLSGLLSIFTGYATDVVALVNKLAAA